MAIREAWPIHARAVLEHAGHHRGAAREKLIELLASQNCALTAQQLEQGLRDRYSNERPVGRATIYRTLELLQENDLISRVEVGDGISRYEPVDPNHEEHHHHLVCDSCGSLYPFDDSDLERSIDALSRRHGFVVTEHEVTLHGSCPGCSSRPLN